MHIPERDSPAEEASNLRNKLVIAGAIVALAAGVSMPIVKAEQGHDPCGIEVVNPATWISGPACLAVRAVTGHPAQP